MKTSHKHLKTTVLPLFSLGLLVLSMGCTKNPKAPELEQVAESPMRHLNKTVTIRGELEKFYAPNALLLANNDWFDEEKIFVVFNPKYIEDEATEGDRLSVTGKVRMMSVTEIEEEIKSPLSKKITVDFEEEPFVLGENIVAIDR